MLRKILLFLACLLAPAAALAVETVKSPVVDEGLLEFEQKGKYQHDQRPTRSDEKEIDFNAAYGITDRWKTKIEFTFEQKRDSDFHYKNMKWENIVNLNGRDTQKEIIFALYQELIIADRPDYTHSFTLGGIARRDFGKFVNMGNLFVRRDMGETARHGISVIYRWQSKYSLLPYFEPGLEILGDTQRRDAFQDQSLVIGPTLYGSFSLGDVKGFGYEVGYLMGTTPASRDGMVKWKLKYGYHF